MLDIIDSLRLIIRNMLEKKGRVFLTIAGIVIGIFTFTFFLFVSQGLSNAITSQFSTLGANVLAVRPIEYSSNDPGGKGLTDTDIEKIKQVISDYKYIAGGIYNRVKFDYGNKNARTISLAYKGEYLDEIKQDLNLKISKGRFLRANDKGVVVLGYKFAKDSFEDTKIKVGSSLKVDGESYRVIGILKEKGDLILDNAAIFSFEDMKKISKQDTYSLIRIKFLENADLDYYKKAIERKLNPNSGEKRVEITSPEQIMEQFNQILGILTAIIIFISSIALVVGGVNVMNTMYSNVIERINEISVMKAIGAKNSDIRNLYILESSFFGLLGGLIGFFSAYLFAEFLSYFITNFYNYNVPISFDWFLFISVVIGTMLLTIIFGTYPAIKASNINPAENLRDE